MLNRCSV